MNKIALLLIALMVHTLMAQKTPFDLKDIFAKPTFSMKSNGGFNTMNDGERYTSLERKNGSWAINSYSITDQKLIGSIDGNCHRISVFGLSVRLWQFYINRI